MAQRRSSTKGFKRTDSLLSGRIRAASEKRGFAQTRLLTGWAEIAGPDIAGIARPVDVSYGRGGLGATLTLLTTGPHAPLLEMQKETLRTRVNAVYGYNAISRVRVTQTAPEGFADGQVVFDRRGAPETAPERDPAVQQAAADVAAPVRDEGLRGALAQLGEKVLSKSRR